MLVVLDTNVIVSALHFPQSRLAKILASMQAGRINLAVSPFILDEVEGVLVKKFGWIRDRAQEAIELIRSMAVVVVDPKESISVVKGSGTDNRILECALEAKANFLITGDKEHLLPLRNFLGIRIVSPAEFLDSYSE
ncbi:MAG: putative toxin-antitoxin system toxin component, PIN family [Nitrososphaerales archaeon]|nr:putative toxin-antitoxin system toxin component, PIN family [Nitrospirota bacterium]